MNHVSGLAERIRILILRGEIASGEMLIEVLLAERFRSTLAALREALRLLEGRGLLLANGSGGMRVVEVGSEELAETLQVRAALEALCAAQAAARGRQGHLTADGWRRVIALVDAVERAASEDRLEAAVFADRTLHLSLAALADNGPAYVSLDHLWDRIVVAQLQSAAWRSPGGSAEREHHELVAAIFDGDDDEATAVARDHALALLRPSAPRGSHPAR